MTPYGQAVQAVSLVAEMGCMVLMDLNYQAKSDI